MDYPSNPGVGETVTVFGLKGQYILFAIIAIVLFIIIAAVLSNMDIPILLTILVIISLATIVLGGIIRVNKRFGQYGLMKVFVLHRLPQYIRNTVEIRKTVKRK